MGSRLTHADQQQRWDKEHQKPTIRLKVDASVASSSVQKFYKWLSTHIDVSDLHGIEMCCGKGRNTIWLAKRSVTMVGTDFSPTAISEAKRRAKEAGVTRWVDVRVHDATKAYELPARCMDFAFDCFGSTNIESAAGRKKAAHNLLRLLKPGGYLMIYLLSTDDEYSQELFLSYPGPEHGSYIHPLNGKYEKAFSEDEIKELYGGLNLILIERVPKKATFFDKEYKNNYIWAIFQKPDDRRA